MEESKFSVEAYISYLLSEPLQSSAVKASQVLGMSHDKIGRCLLEAKHGPCDLFENVKPYLDLKGGILSVDDTILDKPYSQVSANELISHFYSGKHHRVVKGICLITLVYTDINGLSFPVNFRVYQPKGEKTKHHYFQEMYTEVRAWGLSPAFVTADAWYASIESLKFLRKWEVNIFMGLESNRVVSTQPKRYQRVDELDIDQDGTYTHLKKFDMVKVFRIEDKKGHTRHYLLYVKDEEELKQFNRTSMLEVKRAHWTIETTFRVLKQCCQIERFFFRRAKIVSAHIFCALRAFQQLNLMVKDDLITSVYELRKTLFLDAQRAFSKSFA